MARDVPDLALMLDAMAALTRHDPLSRPGPAGGFQAALDAARPPRRVGFSVQLVGPPHGDAHLLGAAALVEQALGFHLPALPA